MACRETNTARFGGAGGGHDSISDDGNGNVVIASDKKLLFQGQHTDAAPTIATVGNPTYGIRLIESSGQTSIGANSVAVAEINQGSFRIKSTSALRVGGQMYSDPSATQSITGTGDTITDNALCKRVSADGVYTLTNPIGAGTLHQIIIIENVGANALTLQEGPVIAANGGVVMMKYSSDDAVWKQVNA